MINLSPTNLWAIPVPVHSGFYYINETGILSYDPDINTYEGHFHYPYKEKLKDWRILGIVTANAIDFDCSMYVAHYGTFNIETKEMKVFFKNYTDDKMDEISPSQSFYSLLQANGLHFENPVKMPVGLVGFMFFGPDGKRTGEALAPQMKEWQTAEKNIVKKLLILKSV